MGPSPSPDSPVRAHDAWLLDLADQAIRAGLAGEPVPLPALADLPPELRCGGGVFVTITVDGALNGCIGSIESDEPIGWSVMRHAWSAAFDDPRLERLTPGGYRRCTIEVSLLSPLEPVPVVSRAQLLGLLRPEVDGLVIESGRRRAVFLPTVWSQIRSPGAFLDHLLVKAGLAPGELPRGLAAARFTTHTAHRVIGRGG